MESFNVSRFKAHCLAILDEVARGKKRVIITKRGKPIAEVIPYEPDHERLPLKDTVAFIGDIVSSVGEEDWEVLR